MDKRIDFVILLFTLFGTSCIKGPTGRVQSGSVQVNTPASVSKGNGRIFPDNPIILSSNPELPADTDLKELLPSDQIFITNNTSLTYSCQDASDCFSIRENADSSTLSPVDGKWAFEVGTAAFLEVHTFSHQQQIIDRFIEDLTYAYSLASPTSGTSTSSLPGTLFSTKAHWLGGVQLLSFAKCPTEGSFYNPSSQEICYGHVAGYESIQDSTDPTIIYHEMGHFFTKAMLNQRNVASSLSESVDMGQSFYDEAASLGEGIADFFSYYMNGRSHIGEWALGRFLNLSRPLSETDPIHTAPVSTSTSEKLEYPQYVNYDPNDLTNPFEDVHLTGQITSHYFKAFTDDLSSYCSMSGRNPLRFWLYILAETLGELGDLTGRGSDNGLLQTVNLNSTHALEWVRANNPINFRRFFQVWARKTYDILNTNTLCNGAAYPQDRIEQLLDHYGLLLFSTYNQDGSDGTIGALTAIGHQGPNLSVNPSNKVKSLAISKDFLSFSADSSEAKFLIFDKREQLLSYVTSLSEVGRLIDTPSPLIPGDLGYNNGNGKISPGEILGIALNLYNYSNSVMSGVQVLANDWDHMKGDAPCEDFDDNFPQSGIVSADSLVPVVGDCAYTTRDNGTTTYLESGVTYQEIAPVCLVKIRDDDITRWALQSELKSELSLEDSQCLDDGGDGNECFVRFLKGADQANYSTLLPQKNWFTSLTGESLTPVYSSNHILAMEVTPWAPPGTEFLCRLRVRFNNCSDCFEDENESYDDYLDYEYSGPGPYKLINFNFMIRD